MLDFGARVFSVEDEVPFLDVERNEFAVFVAAFADCDDFTLLGLLFRSVGDVEQPLFLNFFLDRFDEDAIT